MSVGGRGGGGEEWRRKRIRYPPHTSMLFSATTSLSNKVSYNSSKPNPTSLKAHTIYKLNLWRKKKIIHNSHNVAATNAIKIFAVSFF